jgi:hypothetical protein
LTCLSWQPVLEIKGDAGEALNIMNSIVQPIFERTCPARTVKQKKQKPHKPSIHKDISNEIKNWKFFV